MKLQSYFLAAFVALVAMTACDGKDEFSYEPAEPTVPGQRVYFASGSEDFEVRDNSASVTVEIYRPEAEAATAQTVELEVTDPSELFTVPATVTIPAGQTSAPIEITYNWQALEEDEPYTLDIAIDEVYANQYAVSSTEVTITRSNWTEWTAYPSPYKVKGLGLYTFGNFYFEDEAEFILQSRTNLKNSDRVQYVLGYYDDPKDADSWVDFMSFYSVDGGNVLTVPDQQVAVDPDYGPVYVCSLYLIGGLEEYGIETGESVFNKTTGLITLNVVYFDAEGLWGAGDEFFQLYGYESEEESAPADVRRHKVAAKKLGREHLTRRF